MYPIRLGILGMGRIAARVMADIDNAKCVRLTAVAARDLIRAQEAAVHYKVPIAYGSYQEMAESKDVDLVYIATPHPFHYEQAIKMMKHGKHVLCEKPMAVTPSQAACMIECARKNGVFLMEGMWTRFMPAMRKAMQLIRDGIIGDVNHIYAEFSHFKEIRDPKNRLFDPALAGGALLDLGVYPLMAITHILGWKPEKVQASALLTEQGVDLRTSVQLQYASGATAQMMCGFDACAQQAMVIYGTKGTVSIPGFWHPIGFTVYQNGMPAKEYCFQPEHEGHHYQFDHAAECITMGLMESPVVSLTESFAICELCTDIRHQIGVFYPGE